MFCVLKAKFTAHAKHTADLIARNIVNTVYDLKLYTG